MEADLQLLRRLPGYPADDREVLVYGRGNSAAYDPPRVWEQRDVPLVLPRLGGSVVLGSDGDQYVYENALTTKGPFSVSFNDVFSKAVALYGQALVKILASRSGSCYVVAAGAGVADLLHLRRDESAPRGAGYHLKLELDLFFVSPDPIDDEALHAYARRLLDQYLVSHVIPGLVVVQDRLRTLRFHLRQFRRDKDVLTQFDIPAYEVVLGFISLSMSAAALYCNQAGVVPMCPRACGKDYLRRLYHAFYRRHFMLAHGWRGQNQLVLGEETCTLESGWYQDNLYLPDRVVLRGDRNASTSLLWAVHSFSELKLPSLTGWGKRVYTAAALVSAGQPYEGLQFPPGPTFGSGFSLEDLQKTLLGMIKYSVTTRNIRKKQLIKVFGSEFTDKLIGSCIDRLESLQTMTDEDLQKLAVEAMKDMIPAYVAQYEAMKPLSWWVEPQRLIYAPAPAPKYDCDEMDTLPVDDVMDMLGGRGLAESSDEAGRSLAESSDEAELSDEPAESSDEAEPAEDEPAESSDEAGFSEEVKAAAMVAVIAAIEGDAAGFAAAAKQQHAGRSVGAAAILAASAAKYGGFEAAVKIVSKYLEGATAE